MRPTRLFTSFTVLVALATVPAPLPALAQNQPGNQPAEPAPAQPDVVPAPDQDTGIRVPEPDFDGTIRLPAFTEPVQIRTLIDYAIREIGVQIAVDVDFDGSVVLTQPIEVSKRDYLVLLNSFIEDQRFALFACSCIAASGVRVMCYTSIFFMRRTFWGTRVESRWLLTIAKRSNAD